MCRVNGKGVHTGARQPEFYPSYMIPLRLCFLIHIWCVYMLYDDYNSDFLIGFLWWFNAFIYLKALRTLAKLLVSLNYPQFQKIIFPVNSEQKLYNCFMQDQNPPFLKSRVTSIFPRRRKNKLWKTLCLLGLKPQNTRQECIYELVIGNHWLSTVIKYSGLGRIIVLTW